MFHAGAVEVRLGSETALYAAPETGRSESRRGSRRLADVARFCYRGGKRTMSLVAGTHAVGIDAQLFIRRSGPAWSAPDVTALVDRAVAELGSDMFLTGYSIFGTGPGPFFICPSVEEFRAARRKSDVDFSRELLELAGQPPGAPVWQPDGPLLVGRPEEQFVCVLLLERYFFFDYPQGDWPRIERVVKWLRLHVPDGEIWYGGDSSGVEFRSLTRDLCERLTDFFERKEGGPSSLAEVIVGSHLDHLALTGPQLFTYDIAKGLMDYIRRRLGRSRR
jgi:hypothetical protein